jgi:hypothetical protein
VNVRRSWSPCIIVNVRRSWSLCIIVNVRRSWSPCIIVNVLRSWSPCIIVNVRSLDHPVLSWMYVDLDHPVLSWMYVGLDHPVLSWMYVGLDHPVLSWMYVDLHVQYPLFVCGFKETWSHFDRFSKIYPNIKFHENLSGGSQVVPRWRMDVRSDRHEEGVSHFSQFAKRTLKACLFLAFSLISLSLHPRTAN